MTCPYCKSADSEVVETRVSEDGSNIRRRRTCVSCGKRYTTYERIENITLIVQKKDGKREQFDREKLKSGVMKACEKTTVSMESINNIVDETERELMSGESVETDAKKIGQIVAARLKKLDKIAYIRFASVFKRFVDLEDFEKELKKLIK
ncbi:MAG: transcriptional regulator NrdR [Candidatus Levybacteria bacterium RIFCSPHIGHO2_02_FULL_39_36]|nr:MAG: Transcriptional repressor NrdR [Candidatus Levybacteria bacterium GW2011_GWA1_39_11]KKR24487.1 MAG: Transcriptional repressor NrdR [Candidatus Levybacteria bacterium GW2011_GWB1_39_7]KKR49474.1 MAG: Transcriptional repressor NrdR [Candidatus Levybacteria bacterium GW2011_GWA2_40_16]OGH15321.1 MAG: transcriptional regulator NrdR [Candidatus Levybacteria bacterium RIFCSPHIGHO2_01_FULL_38_96]OGH26522.1 MAG: transcriptional regulator NrdR [Candidatus Levybacteria bacterium RIFCSPHIGHO2_12_F